MVPLSQYTSLDHLLTKFGGLFLFNCNYDVKDISVPSLFYSQLLKWWSDFREDFSSAKDWHNIIWNNRDIRIDGSPVLLRSGGLTFKQRLSSRNLFFADSLHLIRALIKAGNASLEIDGKACKPNLSAVFETLFQQNFDAHDALEDVRALHKILFDSPLNLTIAQIVNNWENNDSTRSIGVRNQ